MAKKLKRLAAKKSEAQLAKTVRDSAQQIWLAGLGAFSKTQAEGMKMFETLVGQGKALEARTRRLAEVKVGQVTTQVGKAATHASAKATATWDRLEQVFEDRVARALNRLGVPTNKDIQVLTKRVEELTDQVHKLTGGAAAAPRKRAAKKRPAKKAAPGPQA